MLPRALSLAGMLALAVAYAIAVPPFANVDEADHHTRVQGIASGTLLGARGAPPNPTLTRAQRAFAAQTTRVVGVAAGRDAAAGYGCVALTADLGASCQAAVSPSRAPVRAATPVGSYEPLPYLLPAAVAHVAPRAPGALRLERLASLLLAAGLLGAALAIAQPLAWLAAGVLLAATPSELGLTAAVGGSGLEVAGAIALATGLFAAGLGRPTRGALALATAGGLALVGARALGPLWLLAVLAACAPIAAAAARRLPRAQAIAAVALLGAAIVAQRLWEAAYGASAHVDVIPSGESLRAGLRDLPDRLREAIGATGYLEYLLPWSLAAVWAAAVVAIAAYAVWLGDRRERATILASAAVALVAAPYLWAASVRFTGFHLQGRHVMPLLVLVPLVSAAVAQRRAPVWAARVPRVLAVTAAGGQLLAFVLIARRYAVGADGPWWFLGEGWEPPAGWLPWLACALGGAVALAIAVSGRIGSDP